MAQIIAINETAQNILIDDLGIIVPASGQSELNAVLDDYEVYGSEHLAQLISAGSIVLSNGTVELTQEDSENLINSNTEATEKYFFEVSSIQTSTSGDFVEALNETQDLLGGKYELVLTYGWSADTTQANFECQFLLDDVQLGQMHEQEPADSSGSFYSTGTDQKLLDCKRSIVDISAGTHTFKVEYRNEREDDQASMWDITLTIKKLML